MSPRLLRPRASGSAIVASDADALAYVLAVNAADGQPLEPAVQLAINAFVVGCKADGIWSAIQASCILCGARTLAGALTPLVGPAPTNSGPFVAADYVRGGATPGLKGNGSTKFLNTNRADNADGQNDAHRSVWVTQLASSTNNFWFYYGASAASSSNTDHSTSPTANGMDYIRSRNTGAFVAGTHTTGLKGQSRSAAGSFAWVSGGSSGTISTASSSSTVNPVHILASSGRTDSRGDSRIAFYSVGSALTLSLLQSRVSTLVSAMASVT
jgi:hypothetical protein